GGRLVSPLARQWSAADPSVARVSLTGVVSAVAPGRTALNVVGLLQTKPVDILVHKTVEALTVFPTSKTDLPLPIQGTVKFQVQARAADKSPVPEAPFRWTVGDTSLASFDPASGTLTGKRAGKTTLVVKGPGPGLVVTWQIRVIAAGLKLSAARLGLPLNRRYPLKANFADEAGVIIGPATGVTWTSDNPQVVAVAEDGTVSTASYGHAHITATAPGGRREIYIMDADGTSAGRLTNSPGADGDASFTADGQSVVFHSQRTGHRQIFLQPITSSDAVQLSQEPADNSQPTVSPDGETIAFVSNREGNNHIWLMSKDGANQRPLTRGQQSKETAPHFLRDGSLAYLVEQKASGRSVTQ